MGYLIDPIGERSERDPAELRSTIVLVGCGGTGGFLAESVCRLLIGRSSRICLVDPDRVELHNVARQSFDRRDVGRFKAEVLAKRLACRFGREVSYSVLPYDRELHARIFRDASSDLCLIVGCVDNGAARRAIATTLDAPTRGGRCSHAGAAASVDGRGARSVQPAGISEREPSGSRRRRSSAPCRRVHPSTGRA